MRGREVGASPATTPLARDENATKWPSALIAPCVLGPARPLPSECADTIVVTPVLRFLANTSEVPLPSPSTRFDALELNTTTEPSPEIESAVETPLAPEPSFPCE